MKLLNTTLAVAALAFAAPALAVDPSTSGALGTPANRIVGLWSNVAMVGPCNGSPLNTIKQTLMFNAGGTFVDNPRFPPGGINGLNGTEQRSIGLGTWDYTPRTGQYTLTQRFDWYVNNQYHGYQVVERTHMLLSGDGKTLASDVHTVRYAANGTPLIELCGSAVSTRL